MGLLARAARLFEKLGRRKDSVPDDIPVLEPAVNAGLGGKMHLLEDRLYDYMIENGVDAGTARDAARNCSAAVTRYAVGGAAVGATIGWKTMNPSTLLMSVAVGAGAGVIGAGLSPSCAEIRQVASQWADNQMP